MRGCLQVCMPVCVCKHTHRHQEPLDFDKSLGDACIGLRCRGIGRDFDMKILQQMFVLGIAVSPQLCLLRRQRRPASGGPASAKASA